MSSVEARPSEIGGEVGGSQVTTRRQKQKVVVDLTNSDDECGLEDGDDEVIFVEEKRVPQHSKPIIPAPKRGLKCPVCLDIKDNNLCCPPCGHVFCQQCLAKVMKTKMVCPICRKKFSKARVVTLHCHA